MPAPLISAEQALIKVLCSSSAITLLSELLSFGFVLLSPMSKLKLPCFNLRTHSGRVTKVLIIIISIVKIDIIVFYINGKRGEPIGKRRPGYQITIPRLLLAASVPSRPVAAYRVVNCQCIETIGVELL